jgi:Protein of unknown function (DUF4058)
MPIHDWTRLEAGDFHHFHQGWITNIANALNGGALPPGFMAMAEQVTGRPIPDVVTLQTRPQRDPPGGVVVKEKPATAQVVSRYEKTVYARRADRVVIRHGRGRVVAIIEIVSPGNKSSQNPLRSFVEKAVDILNQGVHRLIVDLFPPTPRDPHGLPRLIGEEFGDESFQLLPGRPLTVASYLASEAPIAYTNCVGVGDPLPASPLFLSDSEYDYIPAPLEETYNQTWAVFPAALREIMGPAGSTPLPTAN